MASQAFLDGLRTRSGVGGMGQIRNDQQRSVDQSAGYAGNPGLAYNMPQYRNRLTYGQQLVADNSPTVQSGLTPAMQYAMRRQPGYAMPQMAQANTGAIQGALQQYPVQQPPQFVTPGGISNPQVMQQQTYTAPQMGGFLGNQMGGGNQNYVSPRFMRPVAAQ